MLVKEFKADAISRFEKDSESLLTGLMPMGHLL